MGYVTGIGGGFVGSTAGAGGEPPRPTASASGSAGAAPMGGTVGGTAGGAAGSSAVAKSSLSISATMISSSVCTMLAGLGGGLDDDRMLRMIIGLLILLAMLDGERNSGASTQMLDRLTQGSGMTQAAARSQFSMISIDIQQTAEVRTGYQENPGSGSADAEPRLDVTA